MSVLNLLDGFVPDYRHAVVAVSLVAGISTVAFCKVMSEDQGRKLRKAKRRRIVRQLGKKKTDEVIKDFMAADLLSNKTIDLMKSLNESKKTTDEEKEQIKQSLKVSNSSSLISTFNTRDPVDANSVNLTIIKITLDGARIKNEGRNYYRSTTARISSTTGET
eukprot:TRINITY_DN6158_c0_g1_i2.p1 TRINITY_DN6158_c0_g1~~TRINITY_DN6158_c0_g1_i2.p1  ORF type:complete len:163 (+),score=51.08 TRINITY_DN6158_c0_g1_i2:175-663(+)